MAPIKPGPGFLRPECQLSRAAALALVWGCLSVADAAAFESDVNYGLTAWLAMKAGFTSQQAEFIATGNRRSDSGLIHTVELAFQSACLWPDDTGARNIESLHYPAAKAVPALPADRAVEPGSDAARRGLVELRSAPAEQASFLLHKLGESLMPLQDSWSHQGIPQVPAPGYFSCDPERASAHPAARGGWASHRPDHTHAWPHDTEKMAKATYEALIAFPNVAGNIRRPQEWDSLRPALSAFTKASTKSEKKAWFESQLFTDTSFLDGITLPDGKVRWTMKGKKDLLPALRGKRSEQRPVEPYVLQFFNDFFADWIVATDFSKLSAKFGPGIEARPRNASPASRVMPRAELAARLKAWRLRDHGRVAESVHSAGPLSERQIAEINRLARDQEAVARYGSIADAFYPMTVKGKDVQPLLPFLVASLSDAPAPRAVAIAKLRHLPYDALAFVAEKTPHGWNLIAVTSMVEH